MTKILSQTTVIAIPPEDIIIKPTGIAELDQVLNGGLPSGAAVLLTGASGTGKTILATQWLFAGYEKYKEPGIYISLTEPVVKALKNAKKFSFFKKESVNPLMVYFTDLRTVIKSLEMESKEFTLKDIDALIEVIRNIVLQSGAKRVVLDSVTAIAYRLKDKDLIRNFIFKLGTMLAQVDANIVMTSEVSDTGYSIFGVEEFISDGIIKLYYDKIGGQTVRRIEIVKMRGVKYNAYPSVFRISDGGIAIFPRVSIRPDYKVSGNHILTGVEGLDIMTNGGFLEGSSIFLTGASGTGKTILSMQFLVAGLRKGEKCIYVSYEESRDHLVSDAKSFGWDLEKYEKDGLLKIIALYPEELYPEEHLHMINKSIEEFSAKRVVIDSLSSLNNLFKEEILRDLTERITTALKQRMITTLFTHATTALMGAETITGAHLSTLVDTIAMLRFVEIQSELKHAILILKMRGSAHDKKLREFVFTSQGVQITSDFTGYEGVISGITRKVTASIEEQLHSLFLEILGPMGEKIFNEHKAKGLTMDSIAKLVKELGDQGIVSERRKEEFVQRSQKIFIAK